MTREPISQRTPKTFKAIGQLGVGDRQRRHEAQHIGPGLQQQQAMLGGCIENFRRAAGKGWRKLRAQHQATATNLREQPMPRVQRL